MPFRIHYFRLALRIVILLCMGLPSADALCQEPPEMQAQLARAATLREKGDLGEARKIYESLLPTLRAKPASQELGRTLSGLSRIANADGHYESAVSLALESAQVYQSVGDRDEQARAHIDAGSAYMNAGRYPDAVKELNTARSINSQDGSARTAVLIFNDLGSAYFFQAKYSESFAAYDAAMRRLEKSAGEPWVAYWRQITWLNLAALYQKLGNYQRALALNKQLEQSSQGLTQSDLGHLYANLGVLYRHLGDPQKALDEYRKAEHSFDLSHDADGELGVLKNTGIVLALDLGRLEEALKTFSQARALAEKTGDRREAMQSLLYQAETLFRMDRFSQAAKQFEVALAEASQLETVEEQWKALYALGRIAEHNAQPAAAEVKYRDAIAKIEGMRSKIQLSSLKSDFLADKHDVYDHLIKLLLERKDTEDAFEYMERSRARLFQDTFYKGRSPAGAIRVQAIQDLLGPSTALVEFWVGPDDVAAVWITKDSAGLAQHPILRDEMEAVMNVIGRLPESLRDNWQADFARLNAFLPNQIVPLTDNRYPHLLIIPDGFLSLLPFELMADSSGLPLLEKHDVTYLPSAVLLARNSRPHPGRFQFPWQRELIAFGDPAVVSGSESPLVDSDGQGQEVLPGSAAEIRQIAQMSAGRARILIGPADRKQRFFDEIEAGAVLLHVSTHAVADLDNPERSRLLFSPDEAGQANNYVFLKELYDLDLRGVSLATLSACDTERGRLVPGEGVQAFSRALLSAGSRSALTTLWRVPDQPTADFMKQFYFFLLKKRKPKAEALRLAKLDFLHSETALSHPRYWAAFVLNGDGAEVVPKFISWQELLLPISVLILLLLLLHLQRVKRRSPIAIKEPKPSPAVW